MIWCVEDDASIRDIEIYALKSTGFEARGFEDSASFCEALRHEKPDIIVLDIMLPGTDGIQLLRQLKASPELCDIPVVMATAKGEEYDKIQGLDLGADYYLTKPFELEELWVRIQVQLRHRGSMAGEKELVFKDWVIDQDARVLKAGGKAVELTAHELGIVELLMRHPKKVFTKQEIYEAVWQQDAFIEDKTINVHVSNIRAKLRAGGAQDYIQTVWGIGFKMTE